jgi:hypothetical protein
MSVLRLAASPAYPCPMRPVDINAPPNGWLALDGALVASETVAGYVARGDAGQGDEAMGCGAAARKAAGSTGSRSGRSALGSIGSSAGSCAGRAKSAGPFCLTPCWPNFGRKGAGAADDATVEKLAKLPMGHVKKGKKDWRVDVLWPNVDSAGYRAGQAQAERES